ncbi:hypothetical protein ES708_14704 [subsurface metagenome]
MKRFSINVIVAVSNYPSQGRVGGDNDSAFHFERIDHDFCLFHDMSPQNRIYLLVYPFRFLFG